MSFKFNIGDTVRIVNFSNKFGGGLGEIKKKWHDDIKGINKYDITLPGCGLSHICTEIDLREAIFCDGCLEYDCGCGYEQDEFNNLDIIGNEI